MKARIPPPEPTPEQTKRMERENESSNLSVDGRRDAHRIWVQQKAVRDEFNRMGLFPYEWEV